MMPHLGGWRSSLFRRLAVLPLLYLLAAPRPTCGGGGQLPQDTKSSSTTAARTPPVDGDAPATCTAPLKDTDFSGHDLPGHVCAPRDNATSAAECCSKCAAVAGCKVWTYMPGAKNCCLKTSAAGRRFERSYVSGCVEVGGSCPVPIPARPAPPAPPKPPTPPPPPPPPCKSDEDCSLNGVCTAGACKCDPGWTTLLDADGPWCGFLDFLPSPNSVCGPGCVFHGGAGGVDKLTTSWGGSVLPVGGKYWMFAAEMANRCTLLRRGISHCNKKISK